MSFKGNWVYQYGISVENFPRKQRDFSQDQLNKKYKPYSSFGKCAKRNLLKTLTNWCLTQIIGNEIIGFHNSKSLRKHTFATLTLPFAQSHCDKTIKRECLNKTLIYLQRHHRVKNYLWKSEVQNNGNIHFHVLFDQYLPHQELRAIWNKSLEPLNYIEWFKQKWNHDNPNSTDIHSLKKRKNIQAYISKYVSKSIEGRDICGHAWGRSDSLNKLKPYVLTPDRGLSEWFNSQREKINYQDYSNEHVTITKFQTLPDFSSMPYFHYQQVLAITRDNLKILN